ncbi:MAG: VOC family protein [Pseudomonadota bacterium]
MVNSLDIHGPSIDETVLADHPAPMDKNPAPIRSLGEIAIRCTDRPAMVAFYRDIVGLPIMQDFDGSGITFFRIAPGHGGHTAILALFDNNATQRDVHEGGGSPKGGANSTLHHLALTVDYDNQPALCDFLDAHAVPYTVEHFDWIGWRGVFIRDPEGNTVEFVAGGHNPS